MRRAERRIGQLVREGQAEGRIRPSVHADGGRAPEGDATPPVSPKAFFNTNKEQTDTYAVTDGVPDEVFQEALDEWHYGPAAIDGGAVVVSRVDNKCPRRRANDPGAGHHRERVMTMSKVEDRPSAGIDSDLTMTEGTRAAGEIGERLARLEAKVDAMVEEVVTRRVRVLDDAGRVRISLDGRAPGARLTLSDPAGVERVNMWTGDSSGSISLATTDPKTYASWMAGEDQGSAEVVLDMMVDDDRLVSLGVDAKKLAPGLSVDDIAPACRSDLVGQSRVSWVRTEGEIITRRVRVVDERGVTWIDAATSSGDDPTGYLEVQTPSEYHREYLGDDTALRMVASLGLPNADHEPWAGLYLSRGGNTIGEFKPTLEKDDAELAQQVGDAELQQVGEWRRGITAEIERIKGILIVQAGAGGTARDRQTPVPPA